MTFPLFETSMAPATPNSRWEQKTSISPGRATPRTKGEEDDAAHRGPDKAHKGRGSLGQLLRLR